MQFITSQFFIFFLGVFLVAILLKESKRYYRYFLLPVSLTFYLFFGVKFFVILLLDICLNYLLLKALEKFGKIALVSGVVLNVLFLAAFKYYNFGTDTLLQVLNQLQIPADINVLRILIPVGISFYTFRVIAHLIDCYRRILPIPSFIDYANYVAFFPQIMSGPIARAKEFYTSLNEPNRFYYSPGRIITLILSGLIKKYVIASYLFNFVSGPFASPTNYSSLDLVMAALAYSAMIFVDFSGYSDFAIAISNLLGFHVPPNFLSPYRSIGLKEFWNRWHISLSAWLRDYVYIPLGGSRKGKLRKYVNIILTMFISGLWHGAGLTFVVWGLLHGIGSVVSHLITDFINQRKEQAGNQPNSTNGAVVFLQNGNKVNKEVLEDYVIEASPNSRGLFVDMDDRQFNQEFENLFVSMNANLFNIELAESIVQKAQESNRELIEIYPGDQNSYKTTLSPNGKRILVDIDEHQFKIEIEELKEKEPEKNTGNSWLIMAAKAFGWAATFLYVTFAWIFFTSPSLSSALSFIGSMFVSPVAESKIFNFRLVVVIGIVLLFNFIGEKTFRRSISFFDRMPFPVRIPAVAVALYLIFQLGPETMPPFIYFNF